MLAIMAHDYIDTTTQDFKTHFAEYVRLLQENPNTIITVKKYNEPIGIFIPFKKEETNGK